MQEDPEEVLIVLHAAVAVVVVTSRLQVTCSDGQYDTFNDCPQHAINADASFWQAASRQVRFCDDPRDFLGLML